MIKQVKNILPAESLRTLYHAMIHPYITYGILAWGFASKPDLNRTFMLQKRALRIINKASYNSHTDPLFKKSLILKLEDEYNYQVIIFMHNFVMGKLPLSFSSTFKFNYNQMDRETRQSSLLYIDRCDSNFANKLPFYNFPKVWNNWIQHSTTIASKSQTKTVLKKKYLSSYANFVKCSNPCCKDCNL